MYRSAYTLQKFISWKYKQCVMDKVVHFEIPADDLVRAQKFYKDVFSWQFFETPLHGKPYFLANTVETDEKGMPKSPGAINGGLVQKDKDTPYPVVVVKVADIDDALKKIVSNGGKVVMGRYPVGPIGLYAHVLDPEGNIIGVWQDVK